MQSQEICEHLALLVIDMQEPFIQSVPDSATLLARTCFAIQAAHLLGIQVVATEQKPKKLGHTHSDIQQLLSDAPVFQKSSFSAMQAEGIQDWINDNEIQHILICGLETPICIYQSCIEMLNAGIDVTVLSDCVSGRRTHDCECAKDAIIRHGGHYLPSESIFYSILNNADHPKFKTFTQLVKTYNK